jgi:hypothetical protein
VASSLDVAKDFVSAEADPAATLQNDGKANQFFVCHGNRPPTS